MDEQPFRAAVFRWLDAPCRHKLIGVTAPAFDNSANAPDRPPAENDTPIPQEPMEERAFFVPRQGVELDLYVVGYRRDVTFILAYELGGLLVLFAAHAPRPIYFEPGDLLFQPVDCGLGVGQVAALLVKGDKPVLAKLAGLFAATLMPGNFGPLLCNLFTHALGVNNLPSLSL